MGVVDDNRLLIEVVKLPVQLQQVTGVEFVPRRGTGSINHGEIALCAACARWASDNATSLIGVVGLRVSDDRIENVSGNLKHP
jgi:hypothetical protein